MSDQPEGQQQAEDAVAARRAAKRARKTRWAIRLGKPLIEALGSTWLVEEVNTEPWRALVREKKAYILSSWHGQLLPHIWANRYRDMCAMVSQHGDGEIIFRIMSQWGYRGVRGSSSKGGRAALLAMVQELERGSSFAITPDGPRGPAGVPQPGVLIAAHRANAYVVPIWSEISSAWHLGSWDRLQIPKPFARVRVHYGEPYIPTGTDEAAQRDLVSRMGPVPSGPGSNQLTRG
jgi:lysophospholipid acyltransferase (LPLAT)-like uncharacterized protein